MAVQVDSSEFVRDVGYWLNEALFEPVEITHHGKVRLVLMIPTETKSDADGSAESSGL